MLLSYTYLISHLISIENQPTFLHSEFSSVASRNNLDHCGLPSFARKETNLIMSRFSLWSYEPKKKTAYVDRISRWERMRNGSIHGITMKRLLYRNSLVVLGMLKVAK